MSYTNLPKNLTKKAVLTRAGRPDYLKLEAAAFPTPTVDEVGAILENTDTGDRYRWTSTAWIKTHIEGRVMPRDHRMDLANGMVPGESLAAFVARNESISTTFEDMWGFTGVMTYPVAAETLEISSDNIADDGSPTGTGVWTIFITTLDASLIEQSQLVTMDGTTKVTLAGTHLRPQSMFCVTAGSAGSNVGTITLQVSGGGAERSIILPDTGQSMGGHVTIPSNKTGLILTTKVIFPQKGGGTFRNRFRSASIADSAWVVGSEFSGYESDINFDFASLPLAASGLDIQLQMKADTGTIDATAFFELTYKDN